MGIEPYFKESDEAKAEELYRPFKSTIKRLPSGRYQIFLPFKPTKVFLGTNRTLIENRLKGFLVKATKNKGWLEAIDKEIQDLLDMGFVEEITTPEPGQPAHCLPLVVVKKAGPTEGKIKVRLCNDASACYRDEASLNDALHMGG